MEYKKTKMSPPWMIYFRKLEAFFAEDEDVTVKFDESSGAIKVYVVGEAKAEAIGKLLPTSKSFGNVTIYIHVVPANSLSLSSVDLFETALKGNGAVSYMRTISVGSTNDFSFIVFEPKVVQYFNDDLGDINGLCSTLYQDLAKDLFGNYSGIYFCTDKID